MLAGLNVIALCFYPIDEARRKETAEILRQRKEQDTDGFGSQPSNQADRNRRWSRTSAHGKVVSTVGATVGSGRRNGKRGSAAPVDSLDTPLSYGSDAESALEGGFDPKFAMLSEDGAATSSRKRSSKRRGRAPPPPPPPLEEGEEGQESPRHRPPVAPARSDRKGKSKSKKELRTKKTDSSRQRDDWDAQYGGRKSKGGGGGSANRQMVVRSPEPAVWLP